MTKKALTVPEILNRKFSKNKLSMITCYDHAFAKIINETDIDTVLVGDSVAMVMHGHSDTLSATVDMIVSHTRSVVKGMPHKFIVSDMPFLATRKGKSTAVEIAGQLLQAGAQAVKIEGIQDQKNIVKHIIRSGIPVMGHIGLTPQFVHSMGGMKVQGKTSSDRDRILEEAIAFEKSGAFSLVLECIPSDLAKTITETISIPTIGIGAGPDTDGQVLVLQDLLGFRPDFKPKFLRNYLNGFDLIKDAVNHFHEEVQSQQYPTQNESYTISKNSSPEKRGKLESSANN